MDWSQALTLIIAVLTGGAAGAVITALVTSYRNRVQPVHYHFRWLRLFANDIVSSVLQTDIIVRHGYAAYPFGNLHAVELTLVNRSNRDFEAFNFGLTLGGGDIMVKVVDVECPDRHHRLEKSVEVSPALPQEKIDFVLRPFNRTNRYALQAYIVEGTVGEPFRLPELSSPHPVQFVEMNAQRFSPWMVAVSSLVYCIFTAGLIWLVSGNQASVRQPMSSDERLLVALVMGSVAACFGYLLASGRLAPAIVWLARHTPRR